MCWKFVFIYNPRMGKCSYNHMFERTEVNWGWDIFFSLYLMFNGKFHSFFFLKSNSLMENF